MGHYAGEVPVLLLVPLIRSFSRSLPLPEAQTNCVKLCEFSCIICSSFSVLLSGQKIYFVRWKEKKGSFEMFPGKWEQNPPFPNPSFSISFFAQQQSARPLGSPSFFSDVSGSIYDSSSSSSSEADWKMAGKWPFFHGTFPFVCVFSGIFPRK